jgi:hypothetical protein
MNYFSKLCYIFESLRGMALFKLIDFSIILDLDFPSLSLYYYCIFEWFSCFF